MHHVPSTPCFGTQPSFAEHARFDSVSQFRKSSNCHCSRCRFAAAWHTGDHLVLTNPMTATLAFCDVTLPRIRYVCDPLRPAYEGTTKVATS